MRALVIVWVVLLVGSASRAFANDTMTGGSATDLVPLATTQVRMLDEDILIVAVGSEWDVTASYLFENLTNKAVKATVGFPEYACEELGEPGVDPSDVNCARTPLRFRDMQTTVDGVQVTHRKGSVKASHAWAPHLGTVWLYDVVFPAGKQLRVVHRYQVQQGAVSDGTALGTYVTRTGATWAGSIGHARLRIVVPVTAHMATAVVEGTGLTMTTREAQGESGRVGEIVLEASDWNPTKDVHFSFNATPAPRTMAAYEFVERESSAGRPATERCPSIVAMMTMGEELAQQGESEKPSFDQIEQLVAAGPGNPDVCRNFVYALYGRRFGDDAINRYFYGPAGYEPKGWPYAPLTPNPNYSDALLTAGDRATLRLIEAVEKRLYPCDACKPGAAGKAKPLAAEPEAGCSLTGGRRARGVAPWLIALSLVALGVRRRLAAT